MERGNDAATFEERLTQLEHRQEIQDLVTLYEFSADDFDFDTRASLFTVDGCLRHEDGRINIRGRDNLRKWMPARGAELGFTPADPAVHSHVGHLIYLKDAKRATGVVSAQVIRGTPEGTVVAAMRYYDTYSREEGRWKFKERLVRFWYRMKLSDLPEQFANPDRMRVPGPPQKPDLPYVLDTYKKNVESVSKA